MNLDNEIRAAREIVAALEDGGRDTTQTHFLVEDADPTLLYLVFAWLRASYPANHPAADGVLGRLSALCTAHPAVARRAKEGQADPIVEWFEDAYAYRDFDADAFCELIVEKLEG